MSENNSLETCPKNGVHLCIRHLGTWQEAALAMKKNEETLAFDCTE